MKYSNIKRKVYRLIKQLELYIQRARTRRYLLEMDDYALKDIGITRQQALQEASRYFWQGENSFSAELCESEFVPEIDNLIKLNRAS